MKFDKVKKIIKLLTVLLLICVTSSCTRIGNKQIQEGLKISNRIVNYIENNNYDDSRLNRKEKKIIDDLINSYDDYIVNLDEVVYSKLDKSNKVVDCNDMIYEQDGNFYIRYEDIPWIEEEALGYFTPVINGELVKVYRENLPIIGEETAELDYYTYTYDFYNVYNDRIEYYYKGLIMDNGLTIKYMVKNNKVSNIYLVFDNKYEHKHENNKSNSWINILIAVVVIAVVIGSVYLVITLLRRQNIY